MSVNAQSLIQSAMKNDFKTFSKELKKNQNLNETDKNGMNLQLALGYFSDENFNKACLLLNDKGFNFDKPAKTEVTLLYVLAYSLQVKKVKTLLTYNVDVNKTVSGLTPIQATEFSTYKYHTKQIIDPDNYKKAKEIQELLLNAGSEDFSYINPPNLYYFGNFLYCNAYAIYQFNKFVNPYQLNEPEYFDIEKIENREIDSFSDVIMSSLTTLGKVLLFLACLINVIGFLFINPSVTKNRKNCLSAETFLVMDTLLNPLECKSSI